jgi:hypothetical protein
MTEPVFTAHDGKVFYRGTYRAPDECEALIRALRKAGRKTDWFAPEALGLLAELTAAMQAAGQSNRRAA